jgi:hypothetical protein
MLCNEDRMPPHWRLFTIILGMCRRRPCPDEINGVGADGIDALGLDVLWILIRQFETGSESGFFEGDED